MRTAMTASGMATGLSSMARAPPRPSWALPAAWTARDARSAAAPPRRAFSSARHADETPGAFASAASAAAAAARAPAAPSARVQARKYGQPMPWTHPHLFPRRLPLSAGAGLVSKTLPSGAPDVDLTQLTPGITRAEYAARRAALMRALPPKSGVLLLGGRIKYMSGPIFYRFRQDSNMFYLTGFLEPDAAALLLPDDPNAPTGMGHRLVMLVPPSGDASEELWNGPRTGVDGATDVFGADEAYAFSGAKLAEQVARLYDECDQVYFDPPSSLSLMRTARAGRPSSPPLGRLAELLTKDTEANWVTDMFERKSDMDKALALIQDAFRTHRLAPYVERQRWIKSPAELQLMKRAADVSASAMTRTMGFPIQPGHTTEAHVQAAFAYGCASQAGMSIRPAYEPVVAGGANGLTIHYTANDHLVRPGDLICMDAGAEVDGYAADITRAWPVRAVDGLSSGTFTAAQRDVYEAVLATTKQVTGLVTARSCYSLVDLHRRSVEILAHEVRQLPGMHLSAGVLENVLYPHYIGHWLGVDLHDTPTVSRATKLQPGAVVTVEPGLYIPLNDARFPAHYRGIGIRVEDDVVVGDKFPVVLTANVPKEVVDVEAASQRFLDDHAANWQSASPGLKASDLEGFLHSSS